MIVILGQLFFFKYFDFFLVNLNWVFNAELGLLNILLPIGISFFSLQTLGYVIDVYRRKFAAEQDPKVFFLYVCFYPQLVAGPIERARQLMPQLRVLNPITNENFRRGLMHIGWGLALKLIIGDRFVVAAADVFDKPENYSSPEVFLSSAFQWIHVYCDFYGYSEMARGLAIMFGINLMRNFDNPFLAINTRSFWQKWHISLTKWVFDYLYFPIVGRKSSQLRRSVCLVITMVIIGLWHGASYNFVLFGLYHAGVMLLQDQTQKYSPVKLPKGLAAIFNNILIAPSTFLFMTTDLDHAARMFNAMISGTTSGEFSMFDSLNTLTAMGFFALALFIETRYKGADMIAVRISGFSAPIRWTAYCLITIVILTFAMLRENDFVYFQF
ncbi:MAG: hypothetical protein O3B72_06485 [Proteobacteria bacterium]|nr:hypothetical protein [Pseudomonadota bacterium]